MDKELVLSLCCSFFCMAFEAACLLKDFIIPALDLPRMASSHCDRGSPTRLPALASPPHPATPSSRTNSHSSRPPCDGDPGATGTLFTPAGSRRCQSMMDWSNAQEHCCPKYSKHHDAGVLFSIGVQCLWRKYSWRTRAFYTHIPTPSQHHCSWRKPVQSPELFRCLTGFHRIEMPPDQSIQSNIYFIMKISCEGKTSLWAHCVIAVHKRMTKVEENTCKNTVTLRFFLSKTR